MRKHFALFTISVIISCTGFAQSVRGNISDSAKTPVSFATLALLKKDSSIYRGVLSDEKGDFLFERVAKGTYRLKVSALGYKTTISDTFYVDSAADIYMPFILRAEGTNLEEISVSAIRKPVEFKNGNITVNIEGSPLAAGNTAYDLLIKLPGVVVDNDVISISGRSGVKIFIDDRPQQVSGAQLVAMLKSMNSSAIDKIEILKNPPVKYDAAGSAGIINIKLKKVKLTGFSGSANAAYHQGFYISETIGLSLNYKAKKITFFSNFNMNGEGFRHVNTLHRAVTYNGEKTNLNQHSNQSELSSYGSFSLGADWFINEKNTIGFKAEDNPGSSQNVRVGTNNISDTSLGYNRLDFKGSVPNYWNYLNYNLNAEHLFDTNGTKLKFNADYYGPFYDFYGGDYANYFYTNGAQLLPPSIFKNNNTITFSTLSSRLDFEKKMKNIFLEAGIKENHQLMESDFSLRYQNPQTGDYITDSAYTNKFRYRENIAAAYLNLSGTIKKYNWQAGLRGEATDVNTLSKTNGVHYNRQYSNLFPTASLGYNPNDKNNFQLAYNNRINRPDYNSFNPYRQFFGNLLSYSMGNPYLLPEYSNTIDLSHTWHGKISNSFSYSRVTHFIYNNMQQNNADKTSSNMAGNLNNSETFAYSLYLQQDIFKWWTSTLNFSAYHFSFSGPMNGTYYSSAAFAAYGYLSEQLLLPKNTKAEVSALYISPWLSGINHFKSRYSVNFAIRKTFMRDKFNFSIGIDDIFFSMGQRNSVYVTGQEYNVRVTHDSRRFVTSLTYSFGKIKVQKRETAADEDKKRMGH